MEGKVVLLVLLLVSHVFGIPEGKFKRDYNTDHVRPIGYGAESDERGASIEDASAPCGLMDHSGSREQGYDPDDHRGHGYHEYHNGVHTSVKAAAAASASSYNH